MSPLKSLDSARRPRSLWICGQRKCVAHKPHRPNNSKRSGHLMCYKTRTASRATDRFKSSGNFMAYVITGTDTAGALSLKRDSAAAAVKKAVEPIGEGCRDVCITDPDGRIYNQPDFDTACG
jgi:hypothetical protein